MRVEFTYNQDDLVDASVRFAARSKSLRRIRRKQLFLSAAAAAGIPFLLRMPALEALIAGAVAALLIIFLSPYLYNHRARKNLMAYYAEMLGNEDQFRCEVELSPECIRTIGQNTEQIIKWADIEDVVPTSDSVDIFGRKGGGVIVRNRAFATPEERVQFIYTAREFAHNTAR